MQQTLAITLSTEDQTTALARAIAVRVSPGDTLLLEGPVGAGKTHFARAFIKALLHQDEDVPSPTFTLVQTYETRAGALWHADLYRLTSDYEVEELGLLDAMTDAVCLIEWPDRLGQLTPKDAAHLTFAPAGDIRHLTANWQHAKWAGIFEGLDE